MFKKFDYIVYIILALVTLLFIFPIFFRPLIFDEQVYFYYAWLLSKGSKLYFYGWFDDKGPLIYVIYRLSILFSSNYTNAAVLKVITYIYQTFTIFVFYKVALSFSKSFKYPKLNALLITLIFVALYLSPVFEGQYSNADNFIALPILLSFLMFTSGSYLLCGFFIGVSFMIKQNTALEVLPYVLVMATPVFLSNWKNEILPLIKKYFLMFIVFLIPTFLFSIYTLAIGTFFTFSHQVLVDRVTSHLSGLNVEYFNRYFYPIFKQSFVFWISALVFYIILFFKPLRSRINKLDLLVGFWVISACLAIIPGGNFFPHYFLEVVAPLVLVTYIVIRIFFLNYSVFVLVILLVFLVIFSKKPIFSQLRDLYRNPNLFVSSYDKNIKEVAQYLNRTNVQTVYSYDYNPALYIYSNIPPIYNYPFKFLYIDYSLLTPVGIYKTIKNQPTKQQELLDLVKQGKIEYVVISAYDINSPVEVNQLGFLNTVLEKFVVEKTFDSLWLLRYNPTSSTGINSDVIYSLASTKVTRQHTEIIVNRNVKLPDYAVELKCENKILRFPENGIDTPLRVRQDNSVLKIVVPLVPAKPVTCSLNISNMNSASYSFTFNLDSKL